MRVPACGTADPVQCFQRNPDAQADDGPAFPFALVLGLAQFDFAAQIRRRGNFNDRLGVVAAGANRLHDRIGVQRFALHAGAAFGHADARALHARQRFNGALNRRGASRAGHALDAQRQILLSLLAVRVAVALVAGVMQIGACRRVGFGRVNLHSRINLTLLRSLSGPDRTLLPIRQPPHRVVRL